MPLVILHHLLNVSVQLANKGEFKQQKNLPQSRVDMLKWEMILPFRVTRQRKQSQRVGRAVRKLGLQNK
jgi:hypothetical protein